MILILLLYAICATTFTLSKATLFYTQPFFYMAVRTLIGGSMLYAYLIYQKSTLCIRQQHYGLLARIAFFHVFCAYIFDLWSLQYLTSIESAVIFNLSPFMAAFFSYIWFHERMTAKKWIGLSLGFSSVVPMIYKTLQQQETIQLSGPLPICVLILSVISSSYGWVLIRELVKNRHQSPIYINSMTMLWAGGAALFASFMLEDWSPVPVFTSWLHFSLLSGAIIIIAQIIFQNLYAYLLRSYTATLLSFAGFTCPFFAALFGWLFLGESISVYFFFSMLLVIVGLVLFYQEELRLGYITSLKNDKAQQ